jgi:hypothetical protein
LSALVHRCVSTLIRASTAIVILAGMTPSVVRAQSGAWNTAATAGGSWGDVANWQGGMIASGSGNTATFALDFTAGASVTLDGSRTIGTVSTSSANAWSLDSGTGGGLTVAGFNITGAGPLTVSAPLAGTDFTLAGGGTLTISNSGSNYSGAININDGTFALTGSANFSSGSNAIHLASNGTLDLSQLTGGARYGGPDTLMVVRSGDTLDGTGTVIGGLRVKSGGTVSPGVNGVGSLRVFLGGGDFEAGSNWNVKLSTANPGSLNVNNSVTYRLGVTLEDGANMPIDGNGQTFTAGQAYNYTIATIDLGSNFNIGAVNFQPTNFAPGVFDSPSNFRLVENGQNLVLRFTPVPEPTFVLASIGGLVGPWILRPRRAPLRPRA